MKLHVIRLSSLTFVSALMLATQVFAADLNNARNTVDSIRQADPPRVSTTTKQSPLGQSTTDYHPTGPSVNPTEPPSPTIDRSNECHNIHGWRTRQALGCN